jgi:putative intracellular protease/amidase
MLQMARTGFIAFLSFAAGAIAAAGILYGKPVSAGVVAAEAAMVGKVIDKDAGVACYYNQGGSGISCVKLDRQ